MRIILGTHNKNKLQELKEILNIDIISLDELNINEDIDEFGKTFEQNALIKAQYLSDIFPDDLIIADDSGLEVEALNYALGIYSKRYGLKEQGYEENIDLINNKKLLREMQGIENRSAKYVCAIAVSLKKENFTALFTGTLQGNIAFNIKEGNGFGYDSIFMYDNKYISDISQTEKNLISHRYEAIKKLKESGILNV